MPFSASDILFGVAAPIIVSFVTVMGARRLLPESRAGAASALAVLAGFLAGYGLLALAPWKPASHWHWLPYAASGAAIAGCWDSATGSSRWIRLLVTLVVAGGTAWVLVPAWENLSPSRPVYLVAFTVYVTVLAMLMEPLAKHLPGPILPATAWVTMTAAAIVLALSGSLRFAQIAAAGSGAVFGVTLAACRDRQQDHWRGTSLLFVVFAVGCVLIGQVNSFSDVPWASYLLIPLAPVTLWARVAGPLSGSGRLRAVAVTIPLLVLATAVALAVKADL